MKPTEQDIQAELIEEKVREICKKAKLDIAYIHDDEVSCCNTVHQYWIKADRVTYNTPQGSHVDKTITEYYDGFGNHRHEFKAIAALLTPSDQPEQTLEEAVRGMIADECTFDGDELIVEPDKVKIVTSQYTLTITSEHVSDSLDPVKIPIEELSRSTWLESVQELFRKIAAELSTRSTKPSYSELEQRVEELEKELKSFETKYRGRMQELQQVREDYTNCSSVYGQKIEKLQEQLDGSVSEADHEREISEWEKAFEAERKNRMDQTRLATKYREWWESEYAKNAEASK